MDKDETIEHLRACCVESSKLERDILETAQPYIDLPVGRTYTSHYAWKKIKERLEELENDLRRGESEVRKT